MKVRSAAYHMWETGVLLKTDGSELSCFIWVWLKTDLGQCLSRRPAESLDRYAGKQAVSNRFLLPKWS
jgi:hypothetical protein